MGGFYGDLQEKKKKNTKIHFNSTHKEHLIGFLTTTWAADGSAKGCGAKEKPSILPHPH